MMRVLMVYPQFPDTFWSFKHALKFVNRKNNNPPLGVADDLFHAAARLAKKTGRFRYPALKIPISNGLTWFSSAQWMSSVPPVHEILPRLKQFGKYIVAGGPLFTGEHDQFPLIDTFVLNEGEVTFPRFLADFTAGNQLHKIYETTDYADIRSSPLPDLSIIDLNQYECMSIQVSRGCPFHCDFCNVTALLGHIPRIKSVEQIIAELEQLYRAGWRHNVFVVDDNFIGNKKFLKNELLPALIAWKEGKTGFHFITEASINLADDPELMTLMARAGFVDVFIGIETPNELSLSDVIKNRTPKGALIKN